MERSSFCCAFPSAQQLTMGRLTPSSMSDEENQDAYYFVLTKAQEWGPTYLTVTSRQTPFFEMFTKSPFAKYVKIVKTKMDSVGSYDVAFVMLEVPKEIENGCATDWANRYPSSFKVGV